MSASRLIRTAVLALAACGPVHAAEAVKLRPLGSIYVDGGDRGLREPSAVACSSGGFAVADTGNGRIVIYDFAAQGLRARSEIVVPELPRPIRVAFLSGGEILALDGRTRRIARLDREGRFAGWIEPAGESEETLAPRSIAVGPGDALHILDVAGARVLVVDTSGNVRRTIRFPAERGFFSDLAVDPQGDVYVVDSTRPRVWVAREGRDTLDPLTPPLGDELDFPTAVAVDGGGRIFVLDEHGGGVVVLGRDGAFRGRPVGMGWKEGLLRYPAGACVDSRGSLVVAERGNHRVQIFEVR